jgi:hypothetical protein
MADKFIEIDIEGEDKIQAALRMQGARQEANLKDLVDDLADAASIALITQAPRHNDYILNHIAREGAVWMPGGAGGGGEYKAIVGIKEGTSRHPLYVEFGTGIYAGRGYIFPHSSQVMRIDKPDDQFPNRRGTGVYRWYVRGQRPQRYFYMTWRILNAIAAARIIGKKLL